MIDALHNFDNITAAGILARAAIALEDQENPAAHVVLPDEEAVRAMLFAAAREVLGLAADDTSSEALEKIGDYLDQQADGLVGPDDVNPAFQRLAERGNLPSDMYEVTYDAGLRNWFKTKWTLEKKLIDTTILHPVAQQHYGKSESIHEPSFVSLFYRSFKTRWPFKDFNYLVVGTRNGMQLTVGQAWRFYPSLIDTGQSESLVDMLRIFANHYGRRVEYGGKVGSFFLTVDNPSPGSFQIKLQPTKVEKHNEFVISQLAQRHQGKLVAFMAVVVDLIQYRTMLDRMEVRAEEIVGNLVEVGTPPLTTLS